MKYIIFSTPQGPRCILFLAPLTHAEMAALVAAGGYTPASAGFVEFTDAGKAHTFGRSDSLNLGPGTRDESLIEVFTQATSRLAAASV